MEVFAVLVMLMCDLTGPTTATGNSGGLALSMRVSGGAIRDGQQVTVSAELKNVSDRPLRVVWEPSGDQPLTLFVDGDEHKLPPMPARAALIGWLDLAPSASLNAAVMVPLAPGPHTLRWQYAVDKGPYGRRLKDCWTGRLSSTATIQVPIPFK